MATSVTFRPIQPEDRAFLFEVYASTRVEELAVTGWSAGEIETFLRMQFEAQHHHYQTYYPRASFQVILEDDRPVGRLYIAYWKEEIRLVDLALLPAHRNKGIGTGILQGVQAEAESTGKPVRIHVEKLNPALRLYERLGFIRIADKGVYWFLEWVPGSSKHF